MNQTITAPNAPTIMASNACALFGADRTLLIQASLIVTALERKTPMYRIVKKRVLNPTEILGYNNPDDKRDPRNGSVCGIRCVEMEPGEPDTSGRRPGHRRGPFQTGEDV